LTDLIAGLDVIAPHVTIQPPGERATAAAGAETTDQILRAQMAARISGDRIEASAESMAGVGFDHPARFGASHRGHDAALCAREARELEAGACPSGHPSSGGHPARTAVDPGDSPRGPQVACRAGR
jgi:hypothetical protein